jgi:protein-S-isoprenylcysteine O-methyltransferase Ste14
MNNPQMKIWRQVVVSIGFIGLVLFLCAGTIRYWQAWIYLAVVGVASVLLALYVIKDPVLLKGRATLGPSAEQRPIQKVIVLATGIPAIAVFILPGLDHRFGWSSAPSWLSIGGDLLMAGSFWLVYLVFKENSFGSATVEIVKDQKVISTGPYAVVRNPMYSCGALFFVATAFALGSYWDLIPAVFTVLSLVWRLSDEEHFLAQQLSGYKEYCAKVRWHLIPGIF